MIIGVCGYGFIGSSAFLDLLKEYNEVSFCDAGERKVLEFSIAYETDGLLDLEYNLTKMPAKHLKGDKAILRFLDLVKIFERSFKTG